MAALAKLCKLEHPRPTAQPAKSRNRGETNGRAKLTQRDADNARALHEDGMSVTEIAEKMGVSKALVSYIVRYLRW